MLSTPYAQPSQSWITAISGWWANCVRRHRALQKLSQLKSFAEEEIERIASEAGLTADELHELVDRGPYASNLLFERMSKLDLDRTKVAKIEPRVFEKLKKNCASCDSRRRCIGDLARGPDDPVWEEYCPNAITLNSLNALPWMLRNEW